MGGEISSIPSFGLGTDFSDVLPLSSLEKLEVRKQELGEKIRLTHAQFTETNLDLGLTEELVKAARELELLERDPDLFMELMDCKEVLNFPQEGPVTQFAVSTLARIPLSTATELLIKVVEHGGFDLESKIEALRGLEGRNEAAEKVFEIFRSAALDELDECFINCFASTSEIGEDLFNLRLPLEIKALSFRALADKPELTKLLEAEAQNKDQKVELRLAAIKALANHSRAAGTLIELLDSNDSRLAIEAAQALSTDTHKESAQALRVRLSEAVDPALRIQLIKSLANHPEHSDILLRELSSTRPLVASEAALALKNHSAGLLELKSLAEKRTGEVRESAIKALAGKNEARAFLEELFSRPENANDLSLAIALPELKKSQEILLDAACSLTRHGNLVAPITDALIKGKIEAKRLEPLMNKRDDLRRGIAAKVLCELPDGQAGAIEMLHSDSSIEVLEYLTENLPVNQESQDALLKALTSNSARHPRLPSAAAIALGEYRGMTQIVLDLMPLI